MFLQRVMCSCRILRSLDSLNKVNYDAHLHLYFAYLLLVHFVTTALSLLLLLVLHLDKMGVSAFGFHALCVFDVALHISIIQEFTFCCKLSQVDLFLLRQFSLVLVLPLAVVVVFAKFLLTGHLTLTVNVVDAVEAFIFIVAFTGQVPVVVNVNGSPRRHTHLVVHFQIII